MEHTFKDELPGEQLILVVPGLGKERQDRSLGPDGWPASLAYISTFQAMKDPVSKTKVYS